jgi:hypothetical protein
MIWVAGQIVRDDELSVSVLDRTFEHGLGLFETFRTWNGHATLLPRHLERLKNAAADLGLPVPKPWQLPTEKDVHDLLIADGRVGDSTLRITMSGGVAGSPTGAMVWMRSAELPAGKKSGYVIGARLMMVNVDSATISLSTTGSAGTSTKLRGAMDGTRTSASMSTVSSTKAAVQISS